MSAPVTDPADELAEIISDIENGIVTAETTVRIIDAGIRTLLDQLPGWAVDGIRVELADMQRTFDEKIAELRRWITYRGDPAALRRYGAVWANDIGAVASRAGAFASLNGVAADDRWSGAAADAYRNTLPAQKDATAAFKAAGDEIGAAFEELANAISNFWTAINIALIGLVVAIISAVASAVSVVAAPLGIAAVATALTIFATAGTAAWSALNDIMNQAATRSAEIERRLSNDNAFPAGTWPRSTTPISADASITDGDDTDWHLK
jgi:effector-binding domain-containing protein